MKHGLPLLLLALGGCATQADRGPTGEQEELARDLAGRSAGEPQSCIPTQATSGLTGVDSRTVVQRSGRTIWVNRLDADCPGLRPFNTLIVEAHGSQYCRGDHIRMLEPGATIPGPICVLRDWTPYRTPGD